MTTTTPTPLTDQKCRELLSSLPEPRTVEGCARVFQELANFTRQRERELSEAKDSCDKWAKLCAKYHDQSDKWKADTKTALNALQLVLPMAKGYASEHPVGNNLQFIMEAETVISAHTKLLEEQ